MVLRNKKDRCSYWLARYFDKCPQNSIKVKVLPSVDWGEFKEIRNFSLENVKTVRIFTLKCFSDMALYSLMIINVKL